MSHALLGKVSNNVARSGLMPESSALPTLVWKSGIEYLLSYHVGEGCSFRHRRDSDVAREFGDVLHFYCHHRVGRPLYVRIRRFYVQNFSELAHHDGESSFVPELFMQIGELYLDRMREERFRSLHVRVEVRVVSGKGKTEATPFHRGQLSGRCGSFFVLEEDQKETLCEKRS